MKELTIDEIKEIELEILVKVAKFCDDNNLTYFLCAGTMLGAIRHKGFIPWDDDVDIMIPRPDYDRMIEIFKDDQLVMYSHKAFKDFDKPYSKISNSRTILIENAKSNYEIGVNIDVFPIDGFPSEEKSIVKHVNKIRKYYNLLVFRNLEIRRGRSIIKNLFLILGQPIVRLISKQYLINKIESLSTKYCFESVDNAGIGVWGYGIREVCPREIYNGFVDCYFEGYKFKGVKDYDTYLSNVYGDYMKLPPIENRVTHHDFKAYLK